MTPKNTPGTSVAVGIVGTGWWADTMYMQALRTQPDAAVVAICGSDTRRTAAFADKHGIQHKYTDPVEMFHSGHVDAVIVSTHNSTHYSHTLAALDAGLHVLCEKPLAATYTEAKEMADRARQTGATTMVPFTYRNMPVPRFVKRLLDEDFIGRPHRLDLRYWTGYARSGEYLWRLDPELAGPSGVLGDLGSHWIDMAQWFFGEIEAVTCVTSRQIDRAPRPDRIDYEPSDDGASLVLEFSSGAHGVIVVSAVCYEDSEFGQRHQFDLHGRNGTIHALNDWKDRQQVLAARDGGELEDQPIPADIWGGAARSPVGQTFRDVFRTSDVLARAWVSAIRDGRRVEPDFDTGAAVQRVVDAAELSARQARRITVGEIA